jgi:hypothetical protein
LIASTLDGLLESSTGRFWTVLILDDYFIDDLVAGRDLPETNPYLRVTPATLAWFRRCFFLGQPQLAEIVVQTNESSSNPRFEHQRPPIPMRHHEIVT